MGATACVLVLKSMPAAEFPNMIDSYCESSRVDEME